RVWKMNDASRVCELMAEKKLVIADGHHRYETALAFRDENPATTGAQFVPMAFVNMNAPGLRILATHRVVSGLPEGWVSKFFEAAKADFDVAEIDSLDAMRAVWEIHAAGNIGLAVGAKLYLLRARDAAGSLDVSL